VTRDEQKAILEGIVEELNLRWRHSDFYFAFEKGEPPYADRVVCTQTIAGRFRRCLVLAISGDRLVIFAADDDMVRLKVKFDTLVGLLLMDPDCINKMHDVVAAELFKAK
jgi:hypothetical protein